MEARFKIGTKYMSAGKHKRECTVIDIYKTYNNAGELVRIYYVSQHDFMGQIVNDYEVPESTIVRGLIK